MNKNMINEIISHAVMCNREDYMLQSGMHFQCGDGYSIILMNVQPNAPYKDRLEDDGAALVYEGHNAKRSATVKDTGHIDQPEKFPSGKLTENGKFYAAAREYKKGQRTAEHVRVYEKIKDGIWSYNGEFELVDAWKEKSDERQVFKFRLHLLNKQGDTDKAGKRKMTQREDTERTRVIPTAVKRAVWKRDQAKCRICGSTTNLHFDHIIPYSKGGSSATADNIQILCGKHNLAKHNRIE